MGGDDLYRKVGRRYVKVGREFTGFPMNGVWLVEDGRMSCIMKVGELLDPLPLAQMQRGKDRACKALLRIWDNQPVSASDVVDIVLKAVAQEWEEQHFADLDFSSLRDGSWGPASRVRRPGVG